LKFFERIKKDFLISENSQEKEKKENEITLLSIFIGVLIAFAFKANFFSLIKDLRKIDNEINIGWNENEFPFQYQIESHLFNIEIWKFEVSFFVGILLTGFFLSFGSKFFHDLLDRLYYAKKASQALNDPEIMNQTSAAKVAEFVDKYNVERSYHKYKSILLKESEISGVSIQKSVIRGKNTNSLTISLIGDIPLNEEIKIRELIQDQNVPIHFETTVKDFELTSGFIDFKSSISNASTPNKKGSIAIQVFKEDDPDSKFVLTCFHAVKHINHTWTGVLSSNNLNENRVILGPGELPNGTIVNAKRTSVWECALIKLDPNISITPLLKLLGFNVTKSRILKGEEDKLKEVSMFSRMQNKNKTGELISHSSSFILNFSDGGPFEMLDTLKIWDKDKQKPIQLRGDSGNLLYDGKGYALGIVFAKSNKFTYAMDINVILNEFNLKLIKQ